MKACALIATYNNARTLEATVLGAREQIDDVIVVDDGSTDGTADLLTGYTDARLQMLRQPNAGAAAARNAGLARASGEFIACLDSDDHWQPYFLEKLVGALQAVPAAGFAYCDYTLFGDGVNDVKDCLADDEKLAGDIFPQLVSGIYLHNCSLLIRRACLTAVGPLDPRAEPAEDWDMMLRLAYRYEAVYVDDVLLFVRNHRDNLSHQYIAMRESNLYVLDKLRRDQPEEWLVHRSTVRRLLRQNHRALVSHYRRRQDVPRVLWHTMQMGVSRWR